MQMNYKMKGKRCRLNKPKARQGEGRRASTFLVFTTSPIYLCKAHWENHSQSKGRRLVCHGGGTRWSLRVRNLTFVQNISKVKFFFCGWQLWVVSSTFWIVQILVHTHFDLVSSVLVQFATRTIAQMAPQMMSSVAIWYHSKEIGTKASLLF